MEIVVSLVYNYIYFVTFKSKYLIQVNYFPLKRFYYNNFGKYSVNAFCEIIMLINYYNI